MNIILNIVLKIVVFLKMNHVWEEAMHRKGFTYVNFRYMEYENTYT